MVGREWRPSHQRDRYGGLDRADPIQRNAELCAARDGECGGLPGTAWRDRADAAGAMDAIVHGSSAWDGLPFLFFDVAVAYLRGVVAAFSPDTDETWRRQAATSA